jgi:hypothetical protein
MSGDDLSFELERPGFTVRWEDDLKRTPQEPPDPAYPDGIAIRLSRPDERATCTIELQHPTPRCGRYWIECRFCGLRVVITTAGRPDDPCSVSIPCEPVSSHVH